MLFVIEVALAILVILGAGILLYGARRFHFSTKMLAVTFALTAASWVAFLITTIGLTLIALVPRLSG
mgnify:CR=1 FL=1|jgi:hypothetical protein